jgi:hypothetical protein
MFAKHLRNPLFAYVSTAGLSLELDPITSRNDPRVISVHRTRKAAEIRAAMDLRALRKQPGQGTSWLPRAIVEL